MQQWRGKVFKIIIISMMVVMFLSTWLYSLMYIGWNPEQTTDGMEDTWVVFEDTWVIETWMLDVVSTWDVLTGALDTTWN